MTGRRFTAADGTVDETHRQAVLDAVARSTPLRTVGRARRHRPCRALPGVGRVAFRDGADPAPQRRRGHAVVNGRDDAAVMTGHGARVKREERPCRCVVDMDGTSRPAVALEDPADCGRFHVAAARSAVTPPRSTRRCGPTPWAVVDGDGEAMVRVDAVRRLAAGSVGDAWESDFDGHARLRPVQGLAERRRRHRSGRTWSGGSFVGGGDARDGHQNRDRLDGPHRGARRPLLGRPDGSARSSTSPSGRRRHAPCR